MPMVFLCCRPQLENIKPADEFQQRRDGDAPGKKCVRAVASPETWPQTFLEKSDVENPWESMTISDNSQMWLIWWWFFTISQGFPLGLWGFLRSLLKIGAWVFCFIWFLWNRRGSSFMSTWTNLVYRKTLVVSSMILPAIVLHLVRGFHS